MWSHIIMTAAHDLLAGGLTNMEPLAVYPVHFSCQNADDAVDEPCFFGQDTDH